MATEEYNNATDRECQRCKATKPITAFHRRKEIPGGRNHTCAECINSNTRRRYQPAPPHTKTVEDRFWEKVEKTDSCWIWTGSIKPNGYGKAYAGTKPGSRNRSVHEQAHRLAFKLTHGYLPEGHKVVICHSCDNPRCVNPSHLFVATQKDNLADMYRKGRRVHRRKCDGKFVR